MERIWIDLSDPVLAQVELTKLLVFFKVVDLGDLVVGGVEDLEVLHMRQLKTIQVVQIVVTYVENFEAVEAEEAAGVAVVVEFAEKRFESVLLNLEDPQGREVAEAPETRKEVVRKVQLSQVNKLVAIEHLVEVTELAAGEVELFDVHGGVAAQPLLKYLISQPARKCLLRFNALRVLNAQAVQDAESSEVEDAVNPIILLLDQIIAGNVENDEALELFKIYYFLYLINLIVPQIQFHERLHVFKAAEALDLVVFET